MVDFEEPANIQYELNYKKATLMKPMAKGNAISKMDYFNKTTAVDFNPRRNLVAVASRNCFFTYGMP